MFSLILIPVVIVVSIPSTSSSFIRSLNIVICGNDFDCRHYGLDYCINIICHRKADHGQQCNYNRQCYQPRQTCMLGLNRILSCDCDSYSHYVYNARKCLPLGSNCENNSDCPGNVNHCLGGRCEYGYANFNYGPIIGLTVGGIVMVSLIVFVVVAVVYKKRRERAALMAAYANQSNQGSVQNPF